MTHPPWRDPGRLRNRVSSSEALQRNGGNRLRAAADLGISRKTLYQKLNKYGLIGIG